MVVSIAELLRWSAPPALVLLHVHLLFTKDLAEDEAGFLYIVSLTIGVGQVSTLRFLTMWSSSAGKVMSAKRWQR